MTSAEAFDFAAQLAVALDLLVAQNAEAVDDGGMSLHPGPRARCDRGASRTGLASHTGHSRGPGISLLSRGQNYTKTDVGAAIPKAVVIAVGGTAPF